MSSNTHKIQLEAPLLSLRRLEARDPGGFPLETL
jgi:hypothetical protein